MSEENLTQEDWLGRLLKAAGWGYAFGTARCIINGTMSAAPCIKELRYMREEAPAKAEAIDAAIAALEEM